MAPRNCTGNSGDVGDTVLQTSLVRSLLNRTLFPQLATVHWWGTKWVVDQLFPDLPDNVTVHTWNGDAATLPGPKDVGRFGIGAILVCTRDPAVMSALSANTKIPCSPSAPLDANSSQHLCRQLHTCLSGLGLHVSDFPEPRIVVGRDEARSAKKQISPQPLAKRSTRWIEGVQDFRPLVDRVFLVNPAIGEREDKRTWPADTWRTLVEYLAGVGVVIVSYNPKDPSEKSAAESILGSGTTFKSRYAIGLSLRELAAYSCASTVCIVRDSGPMHVMAAAVGPQGRPKVLGLVSVMNPATWRPLSAHFESMGEWPLPLRACLTPEQVAVRAATMAQIDVGVSVSKIGA